MSMNTKLKALLISAPISVTLNVAANLITSKVLDVPLESLNGTMVFLTGIIVGIAVFFIVFKHLDRSEKQRIQ